MTRSLSQLDLMVTGRQLAETHGMTRARQMLESLALFQDASSGGFEGDVVHAAADRSFAVADALTTLPRVGGPTRTGRTDVLFLFVNGLGQTHGSLCTTLLADAVTHLRAAGFRAEILATSPYASTEHNGRLLLDQLSVTLNAPSTKHVVVVGVSKGVHDFLSALARNADPGYLQLGRAQLDKIKVMVSISGIVRSSAVAGWLVDSDRLLPRVVRSFMRVPLGPFPNLEGISSLTRDPWERLFANGGARDLDFLWVSFVVFPDGANGQPRAGWLRRRLLSGLRGSSEVGPYDGLTESASSLLPPGTNLRQWVIRVRGAHGIVKGRYLEGLPVVTRGHGLAAAQILDPLLRTLPVSILDERAGGARKVLTRSAESLRSTWAP
jgi:hypothetical protein